ncbi:FHA domain-containing protein [Desulfosarcina ovata]|uniref:FHA domain-containing protein n=1 Tax=Desulfosarcina ovata subsp. ovata TaxID=2752305 RepID=A0A5K8AEM0_9BACT|nr:FHA domain-containing protein [Desulfosarcina ovata]BBO91082.1 hypothetical protein DSCOOX_42620 [Desulfosarcina ovata subsp. ovata]
MYRISPARPVVIFLLLLATVAVFVFGMQPPGHCVQSEGDGMADVVFVFDNSGSMRKNDPQFQTPKTVLAFLEQLPETVRVGMVLFDQRARLLQPLGDLTDPVARQGLAESLEKVDYRGKFTDSAAGIERAAYELKTKGRAHTRKSIIFLTDGIVDTGNRQKDSERTRWLKTDLAADCRASGIRILGIAFTENADFPLIQTMATRTEGTYFRAAQAEDIAGVLDRLQAFLLPPSPAPLPVAMAEPVPAPTPAAETPEKADDAGVSPPVVPDVATMPNASRSFWKFYLPLLLIIFVLMGMVAVLVFKLFSLPAWLGGRKGETPSMMGVRTPPPQWELQDLGPDSIAVYRFDKARVTVGRDGKNDLLLATATVSNLHATIEYRDGAFYLEDQRSTNGTRLNDHQVPANTPLRLKSGDRINFANLTFQFIRLDQIISGDTVLLDITALGAQAEEPSDLHTGMVESEKPFLDCLVRHLERIRLLGEKYHRFVETCFSGAMCTAIAIQARENMQQLHIDPEHTCSSLIKGNVFYVICTLPVPADDASRWFGDQHGGFTQFIFKWIKSDGYDVTACDLFCVVTFGGDGHPWVSMTVVPTHDEPDPVEIMSVNFLSDEEKVELGMEFDDHGRVL